MAISPMALDSLDLARWQFGITTVYHFILVPLTIGLSPLVALMETLWRRTGHKQWLVATKFFGKILLINFAHGVATGIVQEFQFGMNWSEYSRFVGNIFGAPLAFEALLAFFMESVFLGLWIFGWDRLSPRLHNLCMWAVAAGTNFSAFFILTANSWMQHPVGAVVNPKTGRAELDGVSGFLKLLSNELVWATVLHVISSAFLVAGAVVLGVSAWWMTRAARAGQDYEARRLWRRLTRLGAAVMIAAGALTDMTVLAPQRDCALIPLDDDAAAADQEPPEAIVIGDKDRLSQVLTNLLGNVVRHTPENSSVEVAVGLGPESTVARTQLAGQAVGGGSAASRRAGRRDAPAGSGGSTSAAPTAQSPRTVAIVEVRDHGPGVSDQDVEKVFRRFYRADTSRNRQTGGSGLGLAIVLAIIERHGGTVRMGRTPGGGATVHIEIPALLPGIAPANA